MRCSLASSLFLLSAFLLAIAVIGADENVKRQNSVVISGIADSTSSRSTPSTTSSSTTTPPSSTSSSTPPSPSTSSATPPDTSTTTSSTRETSGAPSITSTPPRTTSLRTTSSPSLRVVTNTITISGSVFEQASTSTPTEAPSAAASRPPSYDNENEGSGSSGLSTAHKNIIIGVVVGVGGAIILGGLAVVAWRLRRRRNSRGPGDEDDLMNSGTAVGSSSHETSTVGTANSPFKTTLDQYHSPGPVNQASNF